MLESNDLAFCGDVQETQKGLIDAIDVQPSADHRALLLGKDSTGYSYIHFPQFCGADLRIYRHKFPEKKENVAHIQAKVSYILLAISFSIGFFFLDFHKSCMFCCWFVWFKVIVWFGFRSFIFQLSTGPACKTQITAEIKKFYRKIVQESDCNNHLLPHRLKTA